MQREKADRYFEEDVRWAIAGELLEAAAVFKGSRMIGVRNAGELLIIRAWEIANTQVPLHPLSQTHLHLLATKSEDYSVRAQAPGERPGSPNVQSNGRVANKKEHHA